MGAVAQKKFKAGDILTDDLVWGKVIAYGSIKFGREQLFGYHIKIIGGHQNGQESFMPEDDARLLNEPWNK